jgi:hypothetical protein
MADAQFPWDELLDLIIADQRTVPIIGPELSTLPAQGGATFEEFAALQLAERHGLQLGKVTTLTQLAPALLGPNGNRAQLSGELNQLHAETLKSLTPVTMPEPLRLLADIRDFPLFLTTTPDSFLATAIRAARDRDPGPLIRTLGGNVDLPRNWAQGPRPTLFHLFGRINPVPDFALTEEDVLEFLHRMQSEAHRPEQLFDELRTRHLLLIGPRLSNWALRFFLRALHGDRLSEDTGQTIILAGDAIERDSALTGFLRETGRRIFIYENGGSAEFVRELHKRWNTTQDEGWSTTTSDAAAPAEPADITPGAVYLSVGRSDRPAAERLAALLDEAGLDVWFDRNDAQGGSHYDRRIRQHLQQADLFVPLLSPDTEATADGFFRKEWQWAIEREDCTQDDPRFVVPVWVGTNAGPDQAPAPFRRHSLQKAPGGQPSPEFLRCCIDAVRLARTQRNV